MAVKMKTKAWSTRLARPDLGEAFIPDVARTHEHLLDDEAESYAEEFIASVTSAESPFEDARDEMITEELGGPFLELVRDADTDSFVFVEEEDATA
jgi:hypothetical protein